MVPVGTVEAALKDDKRMRVMVREKSIVKEEAMDLSALLCA